MSSFTELFHECQDRLKEIELRKLKLLDLQDKRNKWEAEQEMAAAFDRQDLRNEQQRKAFILDQKYKAGSPWQQINHECERLKVKVSALESEYRLNYLMLTFLSNSSKP